MLSQQKTQFHASEKERPILSPKPQANKTGVNNTMHMDVPPYNVMNIDKQVRLTSIDLVAQQAKAKRGARASFFFRARAERMTF